MNIRKLFKRDCKCSIKGIDKVIQGSELLSGGVLYIYTTCVKCGKKDMSHIDKRGF